jgi:hypothetical protein
MFGQHARHANIKSHRDGDFDTAISENSEKLKDLLLFSLNLLEASL